MLWAPICLIQNAIVPASTLWAGLLVGGLLFVMGLIELFAPAYALVAGAIGIVLSLVSLITVLGGFGVGILLGLLGSSYAVAWRPASNTGSRRVFWSVFGCSLATLSGMLMLVMDGAMAVAAPLVTPYTSTTGQLECRNTHAVPAISRVDHRTPVILSHADWCESSNIVVTQKVLLGRTITITEAHVISRGVTSEAVASQAGTARNTNGSLSAANGLTQDIAVSRETNIISRVLFSSTESATASGLTFSIS